MGERKNARMKLEKWHFGNSLAGSTLIKELKITNNDYVSAKISKIYNAFCRSLNQLEKCDHYTKSRCAHLLLHQSNESILNVLECPENIKDLAKNIIKKEYRKHTCWEIERSLNDRSFGKCQVCGLPAVARLKIKTIVKSKYCQKHSYNINDQVYDLFQVRI